MTANEGSERTIFDRRATSNSELLHDEIWDDSLLIEEYDKLTEQARRALAVKLNKIGSVSDSDSVNSSRVEFVSNSSRHRNPSNEKKKKKKKSKKKSEWNTGDPCRAKYVEDNLYYEGTIMGINNATGTCHVMFIGYNNIEEINKALLLKSRGDGARKKQIRIAEKAGREIKTESSRLSESVTECSNSETQSGSSFSTFLSANSKHKQKSNRHYNQSIPTIPLLPPPPAIGLVQNGDQMDSEALHTMLMSWYMTGYHTGFYQGLNQAKKHSNRH